MVQKPPQVFLQVAFYFALLVGQVAWPVRIRLRLRFRHFDAI